jgi:hypothetical protein
MLRTQAFVRSRWRLFLAVSVVAVAIAILNADVIRSTDSTHWGLDSLDGARDGSFHQTLTGAGVNIYVIDTGVRSSHADFKDAQGNSRVTYVGDFCNSTALGGAPRTTSPETVTYNDGYDGHGTHNGSYAAGNLSGAAKDAHIFSLRAQGHDDQLPDADCGESHNQAAMTWAVKWVTQHGVRPAVVNISFCGNGDSALEQAIHTSTVAGFVFTLSGCTDHGDVTVSWGPQVPYEALVVGGIRSDNTRINTVNYGAALALYAPAAGMTAAGVAGDTDYSIPESCCGFGPGDSFAAPIVAGVAALYLQAHPGALPREVRQAVIAGTLAGIVANPGDSPNLVARLTDAFGSEGRVGAIADFDGDGNADPAVWRASTATWYVAGSAHSYAALSPVHYGDSSLHDIPQIGYYDADSRPDYALWRPTDGKWYILNSTSEYTMSTVIPWGDGTLDDRPVAADYDGDTKTDLAVWRPGTGMWYVLTSLSHYTSWSVTHWGDGSSGDIPLTGDFDGDGKADFAVWRPTTGVWYVLKSSDGTTLTISWGDSSQGDIPVPGDFDGDGKTDIAVWRPTDGTWYVLKSTSGFSSPMTKHWGDATLGDVPVVGDFDGDGKCDFAVWRRTTGSWLVSKSSGGPDFSLVFGSDALRDLPLGGRRSY